MNINTANSSISNVKNTTQPPIDKVNSAFTANKTALNSSDNKVTVSDNAKVNSHLDSLPSKDKSEITSFMQSIAKKGGNLNTQLNAAPKSVQDMAQKLGMNMNEIVKAMPNESSKPQAVNGTKAGAKGIAAYNSIAAQPKSAPAIPSNAGPLNSNKPLAA
jgi:uncharacterized membrane protein